MDKAVLFYVLTPCACQYSGFNIMLSLVDGHTLAEIEREEEDEDESEAAQSDITEKDNVCSLNN